MIKTEWPPNIEQIASAIPAVKQAYDAWMWTPDADARGILFAYGEDIYNPDGVHIQPWLLKHEYRHCARQWQIKPETWWDKYLTDAEFRYGEELLGHVEEYIDQAQRTNDKNQRAKILQRTASRLTAQLYNYQPPRSVTQAVRDIYQLAHG